MTADVLLLIGVVAAAAFFGILLIEGARRPGYDPTYHTGSELELGERGWVQRANFFLVGVGMFALAVGVQRTTDSTIGAVLVAVFGFGLIVAGVFAPDPVRGYPPGAPTEVSVKPSWRAQVHYVVGGPVAFLAIAGACLVLAGRLQGGWRLYTYVTAGAGLVMTFWTALAFQRDAATTGLVQRGLLLVYFGASTSPRTRLWSEARHTHCLTTVAGRVARPRRGEQPRSRHLGPSTAATRPDRGRCAGGPCHPSLRARLGATRGASSGIFG